MSDALNLRIPGPTPVPPDILEAVAHPMVNHRGREFAALISRVAEWLKDWFQTSNDVLILSASGTGGLESAVVGTLSPGDKVLSVSIGAFGERFAAIADTYGAEVIPLQYEWGQAARAEDVRHALEEHPDVKAVLVTHNETSTGVTNPLEEIAQAVREARTSPSPAARETGTSPSPAARERVGPQVRGEGAPVNPRPQAGEGRTRRSGVRAHQPSPAERERVSAQRRGEGAPGVRALQPSPAHGRGSDHRSGVRA